MSSLRVMQVVDSLELGGLESVAVNYANLLAERNVVSFICSTRGGGPLEERLSKNVEHLSLGRKGLIDFGALRLLLTQVRKQQIEILHAHGTALFFSSLIRVWMPQVHVVWHIHFGHHAHNSGAVWRYKLPTVFAAGVIAVSDPLANWARCKLGVANNRVWFLPNFPTAPRAPLQPAQMPGPMGKRIVCVANLRPEKDHLTLVDAMKEVVQSEPEATLLLVGSQANEEQTRMVRERIRRHGLEQRLFVLGSRSDVPSILAACQVGVISSASEGMPLALLEYGMAGLPVVATNVGQAADVLDRGRAGILVEPGRPSELSRALVGLLRSQELRSQLGTALKQRVNEKYSESAVMDQVLGIYETVLGCNHLRQNTARGDLMVAPR